MLYPVIVVPGRVNGGLHEMFTVEELMKDEDKLPTEDNGPETENKQLNDLKKKKQKTFRTMHICTCINACR